MKTVIPQNFISKDYKKALGCFVGELTKIEHSNITSILLTGSFARGEATENSDLDIWCIFKTIERSTLINVGVISRNLPIRYDELEVNAQCLTLDEFNSCHFSRFISYPNLYLEAVLLWGNDVVSHELDNDAVEKTYKEKLAEILLSVRHYIAVDEPADKLTHQKIKTWVLKPLMFALRLERFLHTGSYPLTILELAKSYSVIPMSVEYYMNKEHWDNSMINNRNETLYALNSEIEQLLINEK